MKAEAPLRHDMKYNPLIVISVICFLSLIGSAIAAPLSLVTTEEKIETWAGNHPRAASELGAWVDIYKEAARQLFKWDSKHPEQTKLFVTWVNTHQGKGIDVFTAQHTDWNRLNRIIASQSTALSDFVVWCRFHPKATAALMQHQRALHWVGHHLYAST
jgi:hypothetical protein